MKRKFFVGLSIILILLLISFVGVNIYIVQRDNKLTLIDNYKIIEYGNTYNPDIEELINLVEFNYIDKQNVNIKTNMINEENKEYPAVGIYEINLYYRNKILTQQVEIKDSTKPELLIKETIEVDKNKDLSTVNFGEFIKVSDLSQLKDYNIDYSTVDTSKSGEYIAKVSIEDIHSNRTEKEFKIIVLEEVQIKEEKQDVKQNIVKENIIKQNKQRENVSNKSTKDNTIAKTDNKTNIEESPKSNTSSVTQKDTPKDTTTTEEPVKKEEKYWCFEGGSKHVSGNGPNEHGYYKTWDDAFTELKEYMRYMDSGNYKVDECSCGLFYYWVVED